MRRWADLMVVVAVLALVCGAVAQESKVHVVKKGDTLWDLSGYYLTNPFLWPDIYEANKMKINDPHWIYPGQEFQIPPVFATELEIVPPVTEEGEEIEVPPALEEELVDPALEAEVPERKFEVPAVAARLALIGGYLAMDEEVTGGYIIESEPPKVKDLTSTMTAYIDRGSMDGVNEGDLFTVFRVGRGIKHPKTGEYLGKIIRILGVVRATDVEDRTSRVLVDRSYEIIHINDRIMPYEPENLPIGEMAEPTTEMMEGHIVARKDLVTMLKPFDIVYIDQGEMHGAKVGDVFEVYRPGKEVKDPDTGDKVLLPENVVGGLQVLKLKGNSATAYMTGIAGTMDLKVGELIRLKSRIPSGG
jgi:hypothetical protein